MLHKDKIHGFPTEKFIILSKDGKEPDYNMNYDDGFQRSILFDNIADTKEAVEYFRTYYNENGEFDKQEFRIYRVLAGSVN